MKSGLWFFGASALLCFNTWATTVPEKLPWTCDELDVAQCPQTVDKTDFCNATAADGIDTFYDKAQRDDDEKATENRCIVALRITNEICGSRFDPADFTLTCEEKDDPEPTEPPPPPVDPGEPGDGHRHHPMRPHHRGEGPGHRHHGGSPGPGHPGSHGGNHGGHRNHPGSHRGHGGPGPHHRHPGGGGSEE